ncbi:MAG: CAP domain-containing protein [Actinobacteria bacterium]|nr:CAP domain-containing protein [Actinomycetota bacterium]
MSFPGPDNKRGQAKKVQPAGADQPPKGRNVIKRLAGIVAATLIVTLLSPGIATGAPASDSSCWDYGSSEQAFGKKNNAERSGAGVRKLTLDPELSRVALQHTEAMVKAASGSINGDDLFHSTPRQLRKRVTGDWNTLGENVGVGGNVSSLHKAFMNSTTHRDNMLNRVYDQIGWESSPRVSTCGSRSSSLLVESPAPRSGCQAARGLASAVTPSPSCNHRPS